MASADVKNPCGEFEQRQRIIHFVVAESRKLSYFLLFQYHILSGLSGKTCLLVNRDLEF